MPLSIKPVMCLVLLVSIIMHAACFADDWWEDKESLLSTVLPRTLLFSDRQYQDISCRYGNMRNYQNVIWCFLVYKYCSNLKFLFLMMGQKFFDLWTYLMLSFVMIGQTGEGPGDIITWWKVTTEWRITCMSIYMFS